MFDFLREHQLNIMQFLCGGCGVLIFLLLYTRFLSKSMRNTLILMELIAMLLLWFDRLAYVYAGDLSHNGYIMVRVSNFMVFFLTSAIVFGFDKYLYELLKLKDTSIGKLKRLVFVRAMSEIGMAMAVYSAFTNLYYYFDENNQYHRGNGFLLAYIIPVICPIVQYTIIHQYKKFFSRLIYLSLVLYIFVPIICGIFQIFIYGLSIVNISMVIVSIGLYICMYLDLNNSVEHAHEIEIKNMQGEQERMQRLFDQTATAFVSAVEKKDDFTKGNSQKIAEYARKIAELAGKSPEECEKVYYAAMLHDVGLIGVPDSVIKNDSDPDKWDFKAIRKRPILGAQILSSITEYPYLSLGAKYSHERYNGTGYPEGLKGEKIPEIARIIAVADAYVTMITPKRYREARPDFVAREALVKGAGEEFDPVFADIMVRIIDSETKENTATDAVALENEIESIIYRSKISAGIPVVRDVIKISFDCEMPVDPDIRFGAPSIVLFDAYDGRTHDNEKSIRSYKYLEYGEIWFDKNYVITEARKIEENELMPDKTISEGHYEIIAGRYEDHLKLIMKAHKYTKEVIVALPGGSKSAFIGLTGENCRLINISEDYTGEVISENSIPRIVDPISYIDHMESDIRNVQIERTRSDYTEGIEIKHSLKLAFHSMSFPGANLVWNCPYIIIYSSDSGQVGGDNYKEYAYIKINGEKDEKEEHSVNKFVMKKKEDFSGWDEWKIANQKGLDCVVFLEKKGNRINLKTENLGIFIENTTIIREGQPKVYVALTGDQIALTDIRVQKND